MLFDKLASVRRTSATWIATRLDAIPMAICSENVGYAPSKILLITHTAHKDPSIAGMPRISCTTRNERAIDHADTPIDISATPAGRISHKISSVPIAIPETILRLTTAANELVVR